MRILLKFVLECEPDAAWRALRSPEVFRAVAFPFMAFRSLEPEGFPETWPEGAHPVVALALGAIPVGEQIIDLSFPVRADGVRMVLDTGGGVSGAMTAITQWEHSMAISATSDGRTLYRDRLVFRARPFTLALWPALWAFWQWRGLRIRRLSSSWRA